MMFHQTSSSSDEENQHDNEVADQSVENTGKTKLLDELDAFETGVVSSKQLRRFLPTTGHLRDEIKSKGEREIVMVIRSVLERVSLPKDKRIVLGRANEKTRFMPDVDLTPYGAADRGVSREHAEMWMENDRIYVQDLNSTNGTYVNRERIDPETPTEVSSGDELILGRLSIQLLLK